MRCTTFIVISYSQLNKLGYTLRPQAASSPSYIAQLLCGPEVVAFVRSNRARQFSSQNAIILDENVLDIGLAGGVLRLASCLKCSTVLLLRAMSYIAVATH